MAPALALSLWALLLVGLLRYDPARTSRISLALWLPLAEFLINGSRLPSQWLGVVNVGAAGEQVLQDGNLLDRSIYVGLIILSLAVLVSRSFRWTQFVKRNAAIVAFLTFALLSVVWSDYPYVAFKRWFRDLAYYVTILVVLTDADPLDAMRILCRRGFFVLVSLSVVLVKYFPDVGRQYEMWTGAPMFVGAATSKNTLAAVCLLSVLFFLWDTLARWPDRKEKRTNRIILVNVAFIVMTMWLLRLASSATATVCLLLGCVVLGAAHLGTIRRRPALLLTSIPAGFLVYAVLSFGFGVDVNAIIASVLGRDATLTGRTLIWETLLSLNTNPLLGTGYESFWMGPRLRLIWEQLGTINQAHNGYLQVYLNLGLIGISLLMAFLIGSYRSICATYKLDPTLGSFGLSIWTILLFYNVTEAAFVTGLLWLMLLTGGLSLPATGLAQAGLGSHSHTRPTHRTWGRRDSENVPLTRGVRLPVTQIPHRVRRARFAKNDARFV